MLALCLQLSKRAPAERNLIPFPYNKAKNNFKRLLLRKQAKILKYKTLNLTESNLEFLRCGFGRSKFKIKLKIWRKFYKFKMRRIYCLNLYRLRKFDRPAATNLYSPKRRFCLFQIVFVRVTRGSGPSGFAFRRYGITRIVWHRLAHFSKLLDDFRIDRALAVKLA